jgi:hypothetical protein
VGVRFGAAAPGRFEPVPIAEKAGGRPSRIEPTVGLPARGVSHARAQRKPQAIS